MKSIFKNEIFYWSLISFIGLLLIWNFALMIYHFSFLSLLPITIQLILLYLILSKNKYAKIGIKIWTILFLIIAFGLQLLGKTLNFFASGFQEFNIYEYFSVLFFLIIGILIFSFTEKTVEVK